MKSRMIPGISSIILIFLILCLSVFSLLSISDAKSALSFAERHAASVQAYYEADAAGQAFIRDCRKSSLAPDSASGTITHEIPIGSGQMLFIELSADGNSVLSYYVYNSSDYVIDSRIPVWTGN